ncbi:hypothetical protein [Streptomyces sp. NPDC048650]|uniref:hypothetical protein n=1 Tax=unclassified Streptomyces TaxID=2593676 RepID=UPI0037144DF3
MASSRTHRLGRFLWVVVAVLLLIPAVAGAAYGETSGGSAGAARAATGPGAGAPAAATPPLEADDDPETATHRGRPRRGGRPATAVSAPAPASTPPSPACPVRDAAGTPGSGPSTGRQTVPLSRSGELPVRHLVFRC